MLGGLCLGRGCTGFWESPGTNCFQGERWPPGSGMTPHASLPMKVGALLPLAG